MIQRKGEHVLCLVTFKFKAKVVFSKNSDAGSDFCEEKGVIRTFSTYSHKVM